jgi:hypothetical protein
MRRAFTAKEANGFRVDTLRCRTQRPRVRCFSCNAQIGLSAGERVGFRDECDACGADLHCCRNCAHHDASAYNECRESQAERVDDRERANRCDWFSAGDALGGARAAEQADAKARLDSLFKK